MRLNFFVVSIATFIFVGCSQPHQLEKSSRSIKNFRAQIDSILKSPEFSATDAAIKIVSVEKGEILYERNSKKLMHPASNMKLLTTSTALCVLGKDYSIPTIISYDGKILNGILYGNIYTKGFGNPDFSSDDLAILVSEIKKLGIIKIEGDIVGDVSYFDEKRWGVGWMWDDEPFGYAAYNSALSINHNCVEVTVRSGKKFGDTVSVSITPITKYVTLENGAITDTTNNFDISRKFDERLNVITIKGTLRNDTLSRKELITVRNPDLYFMTLLREELARQQIQATGGIHFAKTPPSAIFIAKNVQPIDSMIIFLNKESDNLSAENTLKILGAEKYGVPGTTENGIRVVNQTLATFGIDTTMYYMVDGSGISHYNLLTADIYIKLLIGMYKQKDIFNLFCSSLPNAGIDGSIEDRMKNTAAQNNLHAKTGSINGVSSFSGYVYTRDGELLAFSILMQNFIGSNKPYRKAQDTIGILMAGFKR